MAGNGMAGSSQRTFDLSGVTTQGKTDCTLKFTPTNCNKGGQQKSEGRKAQGGVVINDVEESLDRANSIFFEDHLRP